MRTSIKIKDILNLLDEKYHIDKCYLDYTKPHELLVATILSAQCTDARVNIVTKELFKKYPTIESFANANLDELIQMIHSTGFYNNKAKNIIACCKKLLSEFGGEVPCDIDKLTSLDGVGRKTANVVRSHIFNIPSIVVDTHVKRISNRLGLTKNTDPEKIEFDLYKILPKEHWIRYNAQIIAHGRAVCIARKPQCATCFLSHNCDFFVGTETKN